MGVVLAAGIEFGTNETEVLDRLQIEDCRATDPEQPASGREDTRAALAAFFDPAMPDWMQSPFMRSLQMANQAVGLLLRPSEGI